MSTVKGVERSQVSLRCLGGGLRSCRGERRRAGGGRERSGVEAPREPGSSHRKQPPPKEFRWGCAPLRGRRQPEEPGAMRNRGHPKGIMVPKGGFEPLRGCPH